MNRRLGHGPLYAREKHQKPISTRLGFIGSRRHQIHNHARNRRGVLVLVNADGLDFPAINANTLRFALESRIREINHQARWSIQLLDDWDDWRTGHDLDLRPVR